jgi:hypothetical protein
VAVNSAVYMVHNWDYQKFKELVPQFKQSSQKI